MCAGVSLTHAVRTAWLTRPGTEQDFAASQTLWRAGLVPALVWAVLQGAVQRRGHSWGTCEVMTRYISQTEQLPLGSFSMNPEDMHVPQDRWKCPNH